MLGTTGPTLSCFAAPSTSPISGRPSLRCPQAIADKIGLVAQEKVFGPGTAPSTQQVRESSELAALRERLVTEAVRRISEGENAEAVLVNVRNREVPDWVDPLLAANDLELGQSRGRSLFRALRAALVRHVFFPEVWEYDIVALYIFECYFADLLPAYFYVFLDGTRGAGKTTVLDHVSRLTGSLRLQSFTLATLSRSLTNFKPVSIDEYDVVERDDELGGAVAALVRQGYKRDAPPRKVCAPKSNDILDLAIAGPKALTFRSEIDDALKDRGFRLPMARGGGSYLMVLLGMAPEFGDLPERLQTWAKAVHSTWTYESVCTRIKQSSFSTNVEATLGVLAATRNAELVTIAVLVSEIAGINLLDALKSAKGAKDREENLSLNVQDLLDAIRVVSARQAAKLTTTDTSTIAQPEVRKEVDGVRAGRGERRISQREFVQARKDAGIRDDWRVKIRGGDYWRLPQDFLDSLRGGSPAAPESPSLQNVGVAQVTQVAPPSESETKRPAETEADPEDLFEGRPTRADLARSRSADRT